MDNGLSHYMKFLKNTTNKSAFAIFIWNYLTVAAQLQLEETSISLAGGIWVLPKLFSTHEGAGTHLLLHAIHVTSHTLG